MKIKLQKQIEKKEKELKELKAKLREENEKDIWLEIPERRIKIATKLQFTGKTYPEILKEVDEIEIADYKLLQELRNEGFKSNWKKYKFLKDTWAFVPNPDEVSKANGYVAWFSMNSDFANLGWYRYSGYSYSTLGVFLIKKLK
ncbi:hypothetical protein ES702_04454 [subsurface metagenome]